MTIAEGGPTVFDNIWFKGINQLAVVMDNKASSYVSEVHFQSAGGLIGLNGVVDPSEVFRSWKGQTDEEPFLARNATAVTIFSNVESKHLPGKGRKGKK